MKGATTIFLAALSIYSAVLIATELLTSQDHVRQYFTDIEGDVFFFAINTSLSAFLLSGTALLLAFAALAGPTGKVDRMGWFLLSQAGMFGFLAMDDRFLVHEALAYRLAIGDHFVMLTWAVAETGLLVSLGRPVFVTVRVAALFAAGCAFFALMLSFDALVPHDMVLRLSIEDLSKSWAAACFLGAGWYAARFRLGLDEGDRTLADRVATGARPSLSDCQAEPAGLSPFTGTGR